MSQKSFVPQAAKSVSQALMSDTAPMCRRCSSSRVPKPGTGARSIIPAPDQGERSQAYRRCI